MSEIQFTIVTASYNYGHYIGECLESVAQQKGVTLEHLVYDGCSTDDSMEVIARYPHAKAVQEADSGMSEAFNKGFRAAKGTWVMWLNADDRLKPGALQAVAKFLSSAPDADVVYGGWDFVDGKGAFVRDMTVHPFSRGVLCYVGCYIGSTASFYRRATVMDEGYFINESFDYIMDGEFYNRLAASGKKFAYMHAILADFRLHGENQSMKHMGAEGIDAHLKLELQFAESNAIRRAYGRQWGTKIPYHWIFDCLYFFFFKTKKILMKRWWRYTKPLIPLKPDSLESGD